MSATTHTLYAGTSGLVLPVAQSQYPREFQGKSRLEYYSYLFNSIEINSCFYKNPRSSTVANWAESVPANFRFTFKLSKAITHAKGLEFDGNDVDEFIQIINHVGDKKGCLLVQFPPKLSICYSEQLEPLLETIKDTDPSTGWKVAVEFRHSSRYHKETFDLLAKYNAGMVLHDLPASATPLTSSPSTNFMYLRFHGPEGRYRGSYSDDILQYYVSHIKDWLSKGDVFVYFNNTTGDAIKNLQSLVAFAAF